MSQPQDEIQANLRKIVGVFRRRLLLLLSVAALVSVGSAFLIFRLPDVFESRSLVLIEQARLPESYRKKANKLIPSLNELIDLLRQQVMSRQVLRDLIKEFRLYVKEGQPVDAIFQPPSNIVKRLFYTDPILRAREDIKIGVKKSGGRKGDKYVEIKARARSAELASRIVVRVSDLLQIRYQEFRTHLEQDAKAFLERQLIDAQRKLEEAEARLVAFREKNRESLPENEDDLLDRLSKLKLDKEERRERIRRDEQEIALINGQIEALLAGAGMQSAASEQEKAIEKTLDQLREQEAQMVADGKGPGWPPLRRLRGQIARLEKQLADMHTQRATGPLTPDLAGAQRSPGEPEDESEADRRRKEIARRLEGKKVLPEDYERIQALLARIDVTSSAVKALTRDLEQNTREIARLELIHGRLASTREQLEELQKAYDDAKAEHEGLLRDLRSLERSMELQAAGKTDQFRTVEAAEPNLTPVAPNRGLLMGMAFAAALGLGFGLAYLVEMIQQTYNRRSEVEEDIGLPVLAAVPHVEFLDGDASTFIRPPQPSNPVTPSELDIADLERQLAELENDPDALAQAAGLGSLDEGPGSGEYPLLPSFDAEPTDSGFFRRLRGVLPGGQRDEAAARSVIEEQFNRVRHAVLHAPGKKKIRSVLITSAVNSEGKTTVSIGLAHAFARSLDHWALLVEADLRRPSVARRLAIPREPGLIAHLSGGAPLESVIQPTEMTKLSVITAGGSRRDAASLVASRHLERTLRELRERYDDRFLIIDAPPVLATAEPLSLAHLVDAVILVVRAGQTPRKVIRDALQALPADKILGIVLNAASVAQEDKRYYYSYYYYAATPASEEASSPSPPDAGSGAGSESTA